MQNFSDLVQREHFHARKQLDCFGVS